MTALGTTFNPVPAHVFDPTQSELDFVLQNFDALFADWRGKRIALHGVRNYARAIIETFDETYHFAAVVAQPEDEGASILGKELWLNERLLEEVPDLVILTERVRHAEAVYQEIGDACRQAGIALFDLYGIDWLAMRAEINKQSAHTLEEWLGIVEPYDAVSFEVPDCLLEQSPIAEGAPLVCRRPMKQLVEGILAQGKQVLFIGRKPWSAHAQLESLQAADLAPSFEDACKIFFMRAGEDGTWRTARAAYPEARILHVGYGIAKECVLPRYYGVDTYRMAGGITSAQAVTQLDVERPVEEALDPISLHARLEEAIEQADIVSFDIFDTLLMRTTLVPDDVFELVEQRALAQGLPARGFAAARRAAQNSPDGATIEQIYRIVQQALDCSDAERATLLNSELDAERESILPREPLRSLFYAALASGKRVFLISDMYHSSETIAELLRINGIEGYEQLLVSSEKGMLKRQGLFNLLASSKTPANRIVHIGDSINNDVMPARAAGIQTILVPSALDLALAHGLNRAMRKGMTLNERCALGRQMLSKYADPFKEQGLTAIAGPEKALPDSHVAEFVSWMSDAAFSEKATVHVASHDGRIPIELRRALLAWYPYPAGNRALFLGSDHEAFEPLLQDNYETLDFALVPQAKYDFIVVLDVLDTTRAIDALAKKLARALTPNGVLLLGFRNRFSVKYLCGAVDDVVERPFDTLAKGNHAGTYGRCELNHVIDNAGLVASRTYYVMPDASFAQAIYTDDYIPPAGIHDRVMPFDAYNSPLVANERDLYPAIVEEGMLPYTANYYLMECRKPDATNPTRHIAHVALSLDRGREHSFITTLFTDGTVLKSAAYRESRAALEATRENSRALQARGLAVIDVDLSKDGLLMPLVKEQPLLAHMTSFLPNNPDALSAVFDQLYDDILASSELTAISEADARGIWGADAESLGPILLTGYIDMVPYNAFWADGTIRYFDQEFTVENCPAKYVLFRALRYTWIHLPQAERAIPLECLKKRFGLERLWSGFLSREEAFIQVNRNREQYHDIYEWARPDARAMAQRRHVLARSTDMHDDRPYGIGLVMGVFDLFHVGHLRLIKRAKARCQFLRVAVLSDDLVRQFKDITPTIPLEQRMEILAAINGVDEVVAIRDNPSRIVEWNRRPFDCFFSGDDYSGNDYWEHERAELEKLGATIEFFPYTEEQSSTNIRGKLGRAL